jgi:hypothetical protein
MGEGMPYHLEKGPTLRIIEEYLNGDRSHVCQVLNRVRAAVGQPLVWLDAIPGLWADPRFANANVSPREVILRDWFGYEKPANTWVPPDPNRAVTGYWIGYKGDVAEIVRGAFQWALELSLRTNAGPGEPCLKGPTPLPIELLWHCPAPWFEAWVVRRPVQVGAAQGGGVSIVFATPSHNGANVAESPIAHYNTTKVPGFSHPVPSTELDYSVFPAGGPTPGAAERQRAHAMWVVTHEDQQSNTAAKVTFTATDSDFADWGIASLNTYEGTGPVVVVSPSLNAGGVRINGTVP